MSSHSRKKVLIAAYGDQDDRLRMQALSNKTGKSQSELLISWVRSEYSKSFGGLTPEMAERITNKNHGTKVE